MVTFVALRHPVTILVTDSTNPVCLMMLDYLPKITLHGIFFRAYTIGSLGDEHVYGTNVSVTYYNTL